LIYYAFDLLKLEGKDLRNRPLIERRTLLAELLEKPPDNIRFSEELRGNRDQLLEVAHRFQLEDLVAKRPNSVYESGRRSAWVASARNTSAMLSPPRMLAFFSLVSPTRTQVLPASCKAIVGAFLLVPLERSERKRQENAVHLRVDQ